GPLPGAARGRAGGRARAHRPPPRPRPPDPPQARRRLAGGARRRDVPHLRRGGGSMTWRERLQDVMWGPEAARRLRFVQTGLTVLIALRIGLGSYRQLAGTPDPLFDPVPIL